MSFPRSWCINLPIYDILTNFDKPQKTWRDFCRPPHAGMLLVWLSLGYRPAWLTSDPFDPSSSPRVHFWTYVNPFARPRDYHTDIITLSPFTTFNWLPGGVIMMSLSIFLPDSVIWTGRVIYKTENKHFKLKALAWKQKPWSIAYIPG